MWGKKNILGLRELQSVCVKRLVNGSYKVSFRDAEIGIGSFAVHASLTVCDLPQVSVT